MSDRGLRHGGANRRRQEWWGRRHYTTVRCNVGFKWPLMRSNFAREDFDAVFNLLTNEPNANPDCDWDVDVRLTQGDQVRAFEQEFSAWLGVKHSIFVNSGSSANLLTMAALHERHPRFSDNRKVLVPCVTWASDITSVLHAGFEPVFVDIDRRTLGMGGLQVARLVDEKKPAAVFVTHCMGYPGMSVALWNAINDTKTPYFEDCCEGPGAVIPCYGTEGNQWRKVGTFGLASNFSFYYAHHMTTVEGGMVCTDDDVFAAIVRSLRGHGLRREVPAFRDLPKPDDLEPEFIFDYEGYNCRSTEINAVIGRSQLKRLDEGIERRRELLSLFLSHIDSDLYQTDFAVEGSSPYALTLVLKHDDDVLRHRVRNCLHEQGVETRRGIAGGGNQLRQPYLRRRYGTMYAEFPNAEHVHWNGWALGLWPTLEPVEVKWICEKLNGLKSGKMVP